MEQTYEAALARLEQMAAEMERGEVSLEQVSERLKEARETLAYCRARLTETEKKCDELLKVSENP